MDMDMEMSCIFVILLTIVWIASLKPDNRFLNNRHIYTTDAVSNVFIALYIDKLRVMSDMQALMAVSSMLMMHTGSPFLVSGVKAKPHEQSIIITYT